MFQWSLSPQYHNVTVAESIPIGTVILEIQATDGDEPATGSSYIIYQVKEGDPNNSFTIETDPETNRGFVRINKVNRWIYSSPLERDIYVIYVYIFCISSNCSGDDLEREVGWWWSEDTLTMVQTAEGLTLGLRCCACAVLRYTSPPNPPTTIRSSLQWLCCWPLLQQRWCRALCTIKKKHSIILVILQQSFWNRESQLNASVDCGHDGGLPQGRSSFLLVLLHQWLLQREVQ